MRAVIDPSLTLRRILPQADQAGAALGMALELADELRVGQAGGERAGIEIGRDHGERVMVRRADRRARAHVGRLAGGTLAAGIFRRGLARLALGETMDVRRNVVGEPMNDAEPVAALGVDHQQGIALVPAGGLAQDSGGETFSPTQFGLDLFAPAFFFAINVPSLKAGDVKVNGSAASAGATESPRARPPATHADRME